MLTTKNFIRNDPCRELHPETTPYRQFFFCVRTGSRRALIIGSPGLRHSKFWKKGRNVHENKENQNDQKDVTDHCTVPVCGGISAPKGEPVLSDDWYRCCGSPLFPLHSLSSLRLLPGSGNCGFRLEGQRIQETGTQMLETILIRQISYQNYRHTSVCFSGSHLGICRTSASFPPAGWRCDPLIYQEHGNHNFAEVSMDEYGNLHIFRC